MWKSIKVQNVVVSSSVIWSDRLTIINNNSCQLVDWYIRRVMIVSFFLLLAGCKWNTSTWRSKKWSAPFTRRTNRQGNLLILQTSWLICLLSLWSVSKEFWDCFLCSCYHLYNLWNICYFQAAAEKKQNDSLKPSSIDLTAIHMEIDEVN